MDKLSTRAPLFYSGTGHFAKAKLANTALALDAAGQEITAMACRAKHIQEAKQYGFLRRTNSNYYLTRNTEKRELYLADFKQLGPRWVKDCEELTSSIKHTGWYTDADGHQSLKGVVLCFTRHGSGETEEYFGESRGKNKDIYMAGTRHSDWDGVTLSLDTTDNPVTAAHWADRMAEIDAESCREEDERFQAEQKAEELREQIGKARAECLKLLRAWRPFRKGNPDQLVLFGAPTPKLSDTLCDELYKRVQSYCAEIAEYRSELKTLT